MVVEIVVAWVSLAFTAAVISALQSTLDDVVVPVVVTVAALDVLELVDAVLVLELTDVTVLLDPSRGGPDRRHAGPEIVKPGA
ncbi:hypothetical protein GCM10010987_04280 [Bradyrhizobium guangdongense]|uniref:Uncharacterized protein n=1 Tax=Bradyrhizobium guangdongense TaxID=1325090 RepID=A0AA87W0E2_9BRAD|nr:hypothetical protein GCM10010987_04280 [Bradyrhizobium guangdongense]